MKRIAIFILISVCILNIPVLYAQEEAAAPVPADTITEKPDNQATEPLVEPVAEKPARKSASGALAPATQVKEQRQVAHDQPVPDGDTTGLLSVSDGDFKYERIPGITIKKPVAVPGADTAQQSVTGHGGFSSLSNETKNNLMRGGIVLLIFILFIFYRSRSGRRRRRY